jgi:hypothetical protein
MNIMKQVAEEEVAAAIATPMVESLLRGLECQLIEAVRDTRNEMEAQGVATGLYETLLLNSAMHLACVVGKLYEASNDDMLWLLKFHRDENGQRFAVIKSARTRGKSQTKRAVAQNAPPKQGENERRLTRG